MRRIVLALAFFALASQWQPAPAGAQLASGPCTADPAPFDIVRPEGCRRILYRYGPLHVTPGDNLIMLGPVAIEKPLEDGFVLRFKPDLVRVDGTVPPIDVLHLHHAVWLSTAFSDPMFASGEEKTIVSLPDGYGIPVRRWDGWVLNYMLHNQTPVPENVYITYELDFVPTSSAGDIKPVKPWWMDVADYNGANPVYNVQRAFGGEDGECAFPRENCAAFDPYGRKIPSNGMPPSDVRGDVHDPPDGTIVWMGGHVHPGGLRTDVQMLRNGQLRRAYTSDAVYYDPGGPISWDLSMEITLPSFRMKVAPGDKLILNSVYETRLGSWYEAMGIVVTFIAPYDASAPDPFTAGFDPDAVAVTHGHLAEADNHGGLDEHVVSPEATQPSGAVAIGAFNYVPGDLNSSFHVLPTVERGQPLSFVNVEGFGAYHTVTACRAPCTGTTGISYPLANGPVEFDSLELGFGPPELTPAANRANFTLPTDAMDAGTYTFFCRIHPFMRGAFGVT